ncbi:MAG: PhoH family protein [Myxococcota bacterium]
MGCRIHSTESDSDARPKTTSLSFDDNAALRELVGEFGSHLKLVTEALEVSVEQRGTTLIIGAGKSDPRAVVAGRLLEQLYALVERGHQLHPNDVTHAARIVRGDPEADLEAYFGDTILVNNHGRPIVPRSAGQRQYVHALRKHDVVFGVGPAGTGKTYLAMAIAVAALKRGKVRRLILTRPAVEAGEKLGFLPGDLTEKVDPYLRPLFDALADMLPAERVARMIERRVIEVAPLAFMRGRTLNQAHVVLDEAQNTTREQMKMFLTRLGEDSRMTITGDTTQIDLPRKGDSGLVHALSVLNAVDGVGFARLSGDDVVRHSLVSKIVAAYEKSDKAAEANAPKEREGGRRGRSRK